MGTKCVQGRWRCSAREGVVYKPSGKDARNFEPRRKNGAFLFDSARTNDCMLGVEGGEVVKAWAMRRLAWSDSFDAALVPGARRQPAGFELRTYPTAEPMHQAPLEFPRPGPETIMPFAVRHMDVVKHRFTPSCKGCRAVQDWKRLKGRAGRCSAERS